MPDVDISMERLARDAVRVRFQPEGNEGTAVFVIHLAREDGGTGDEVDRWKVLLKAQALATDFINRVNGETYTRVHRS